MYQVSKTELSLDIYSIEYWIADSWNPSYVVQTNKSQDTGTLPLLAPALLAPALKVGYLKSVFHDSSHRSLTCTPGLTVKQALARVSIKQSVGPETRICKKKKIELMSFVCSGHDSAGYFKVFFSSLVINPSEMSGTASGQNQWDA